MKANHVKREPWHDPRAKARRRSNSQFVQRCKRRSEGVRVLMRGGKKESVPTRTKLRDRRGLDRQWTRIWPVQRTQRSLGADYDFYIRERMVKSGRLRERVKPTVTYSSGLVLDSQGRIPMGRAGWWLDRGHWTADSQL